MPCRRTTRGGGSRGRAAGPCLGPQVASWQLAGLGFCVFRAAFPRRLSCPSSSSRCVPGVGISTSTRVESLRPTAWALGLETHPTPALPQTCPQRHVQTGRFGGQQGPGDSRRSGGVKLVSAQESSQAPGGDVGGGSQERPPALLTCSIRDQGTENLRCTTFCSCFGKVLHIFRKAALL